MFLRLEGSKVAPLASCLSCCSNQLWQADSSIRNAETPNAERFLQLCTTVASAMDEIISEEEFSGSDYVPYSTSRQQVTAKPYGVPFKGGEPASRSLPPPTTKAKSGRQPQDAAAGGGVLTKMARSRHRVRPPSALTGSADCGIPPQSRRGLGGGGAGDDMQRW